MASIFRMESRGLGTGEAGFLRLYSDRFGILPMPLPPLEEQAAIVRFLDHADRRIERFILAKRKLIALLGEQKHAIIHRAVSRGLGMNVPMKDSGVPWLGKIPAHWAVVRNKAVCRLGTGHTPSRKNPAYWVNCTIPWVTLSDVRRFRYDQILRLEQTKECVSELGLANSAAVKLPRGTVILSRTASVGFSVILDREMATSQDFMAWTPGARLLPEFLLFVLRAMRPEFGRLMHGSTHNTIYMPTLHAFRTPLPPLTEQLAIVEHLQGVLDTFGPSTRLLEREVELARDYRRRLTTDVVTGQLDVREAAAQLPDERVGPTDVTDLGEEADADESDNLDEGDTE